MDFTLSKQQQMVQKMYKEFAENEVKPLAAAQLGQVLGLLLGGAVLIDGSCAQRGVGGQDNTCGAADLGQLLDSHDVGQDVAACTADGLREVDAHHAQLSYLLDAL